MLVHIKKVEPIVGTLVSVSDKCVENAILGRDGALIGKVRVSDSTTSDSPKFDTYINQISISVLRNSQQTSVLSIVF